jgi:hypothetical protein
MNNDDRIWLDTVVRYGVPAVCGFPGASLILGIREDSLIELERTGHLKSLGSPTAGCQRFFSTAYLLAVRTDQDWLDKAFLNIRRRNHAKNHGLCKAEGSRP